MTDGTELGAQQHVALESIRKWWAAGSARPPVFRLFGYAGTGKTTIAKRIPELLGLQYSTQFCAFTGKAASVLRSKGCEPASTIHSLIYQPAERSLEDLRQARRAVALCTDPASLAELEARLAMLEQNASSPTFKLNSWGLSGIELLIIDEVSMIGDQMGRDLLSFSVPLLVIGDPAQLPPVSSEAAEGFFMRDPADVLLTEIHRQVADSPVLELATRVRDGRGTRPADYRRGDVPILACAADTAQVLVGRNRTRWDINSRVRAALGRQSGRPVPGDRVVCLANNGHLEIFNGQVSTVLEARPVDGDPWVVDLLLDDGSGADPAWTAASLLGFIDEQSEKEAQRVAFRWRDRGLFTWAYALTTHKAQGSQWPHVFVVDESYCFRTDAARWLYTGITRASESVILGSADNFK